MQTHYNIRCTYSLVEYRENSNRLQGITVLHTLSVVCASAPHSARPPKRCRCTTILDGKANKKTGVDVSKTACFSYNTSPIILFFCGCLLIICPST